MPHVELTAIDVDLSGPESPGAGQRVFMLAGGRGVETVDGAVGDGHGVIVIVVRNATTTGPKISSWAMTESGSTLAKTVGRT
jgi:hypothetical protein